MICGNRVQYLAPFKVASLCFGVALMRMAFIGAGAALHPSFFAWLPGPLWDVVKFVAWVLCAALPILAVKSLSERLYEEEGQRPGVLRALAASVKRRAPSRVRVCTPAVGGPSCWPPRLEWRDAAQSSVRALGLASCVAGACGDPMGRVAPN